MEKYERFFGKGWTETLIEFLDSPEFTAIGNYLKKEKANGKIISPALKDIFRAFKECTWSKVHTVILSTEPYVSKVDDKNFTADGLAFSARLANNTPPELQKFHQAIDEELFDGDGYNLGVSNDLTWLANQGVLLLNTSLTSVIGQPPGYHNGIWNRFIEVVLSEINEHKDAIAFILMGDYPKTFKRLLGNPTFAVYDCEHPIEARYRSSKWASNGVFKSVDSWHKAFNNIKINWCEAENNNRVVVDAQSNPYASSCGYF